MTRHEHYAMMLDQSHAMTLQAIFERYCYLQDDLVEMHHWCRNHGFGDAYTAAEACMNGLAQILFTRPQPVNFPWSPNNG